MGKIKQIGAVFLLTTCFITFQNFTDADPESQYETMDYLAIEDEVLQTSTDDINAQKKEAAEQARIAEEEKRQAESRLKATKAKREKVNAQAQVVIADKLARRQRALETKRRLDQETAKLEKEINRLEQQMERAEIGANMAKEEVNEARKRYQSTKQRKAELIKARQDQARAVKVHRGKSRSIASIDEKDSRGLPKTLPAKKFK